jgi:hypothetical protein
MAPTGAKVHLYFNTKKEDQRIISLKYIYIYIYMCVCECVCVCVCVCDKRRRHNDVIKEPKGNTKRNKNEFMKMFFADCHVPWKRAFVRTV